MDDGIEEGEVVNVIASYGEFIGRGHYQIGSIAVRILTFDDELTLHDMIARAGGLSTGASFDRIQVYRMDISKADEVDFSYITVAVDDHYNCKDPNFQLQPYDHIVARMTPNFTTGRSIELNGRVKYPGTYVLNDDLTQLSTIIENS